MSEQAAHTWNPSKWSIVRGILEAVTVGFLFWIAGSLIEAKQVNAILMYKIDTVVANTADFPAYKIKTAENSIEISQLKEQVKELYKVREMR